MKNDDARGVTVSEPETVATGIPAIRTTLQRSFTQMGPVRTVKTLALINQPQGFDCPGCAWPEPEPSERKLAEFCENGAKAVAEEATKARANRKFFADHPINDLRDMSDFELGRAGRITEPFVKKPGSTHFEPVPWGLALSQVADRLRSLTSPDQAVFYTSGRASNEAAFIYQLLVKCFGTNNLPDCSNMCHEPTSHALGNTIGVGKGSVRLHDLYEADVIVLAGQNPGSNHPRMLSALEIAKGNGARIIAINPLPEAGLLAFRNPQKPRRLLGEPVELADIHLPVQPGGDQALFQLWSKWLVRDGVVDEIFIDKHTDGFDDLVSHLSTLDEDALIARTGVSVASLTDSYELVKESHKTIVCWAMGVTQQTNAVQIINEIVNLTLLGGHIGRPGAGVCPVRGHSNVQGDRTMGVWEKYQPEFTASLETEFGVNLPKVDGYDTIDAVRAVIDGSVKVFVGLGGNFARATPDTNQTEQGFATVPLVVSIATKLNRTHLLTDQTSLILPTLGRTEEDLQQGAPQFVTVEDSMGKVHASVGRLSAPSPLVRSEVSILCDLAERLLDVDHPVPWNAFGNNYDLIRDRIARTIDGFEEFNQRVRQSGGFELPHPPRDSRTFPTDSGKARFTINEHVDPGLSEDALMLQTTRSHDQYNTTIYGHDDRYRGLSGSRHVVMLNASDMERRGLVAGDRVDLVCDLPGPERRVSGYLVVEYPTPEGTAAAYYPETNVLIPLDHYCAEVQTPAAKAVPIRIERTQ